MLLEATLLSIEQQKANNVCFNLPCSEMPCYLSQYLERHPLTVPSQYK